MKVALDLIDVGGPSNVACHLQLAIDRLEEIGFTTETTVGSDEFPQACNEGIDR